MTKNKDKNNLEFGKVPPQSIDMEKAVLGAVMLESNALFMVSTFLNPGMFYIDSHRKIYQSVVDLSMTNKPIDLLTVTEALRKNNHLDDCGGPAYVTELCSKVSSAANIQFHAKIIEQKFIQRELIRITGKYHILGFDDSKDIGDSIDRLSLDLMNINQNIVGDIKQIGDEVEKSIDHLHDLMAGKTEPFGIKTGFEKFDKKTNGIQHGVMILAARPSMGKSALALQLVNNITVDQKIPTAFFELEMFENQFVRWLQSQRTGIENERIKNPKGKLTPDEINLIEKESYKIKHAPLYTDFTPAINMMQLRSKAIQMKQQYGIKLIIIDYLQLMTNVNPQQTREREVAEISGGIRALSKELNLPIIALSQLSRNLLSRQDKRPNLGDLRESGSIEQDADSVIFIHRPEKYGFLEDANGHSLVGITELIFAKFRDGDNEPIEILFDKNTVSFKDKSIFESDERVEPQQKPDWP